LFMKRWILLVKYGEVKTQKQNYIVFIRNCLLAGISLAPSFQNHSFSYLPTLCRMPDCSTKLIFPEHLTYIS
jgi:hypothetical protein